MAFAADPPAVQVHATRPDASATLERTLADGKSLVSVLNAKQEPVPGLTAKDFKVTRGDASARIVSVQPISQTVEVPRHVVLVLDNSDSMVARKAVAKLQEGVGAVLKAIRPVDDVRVVVFHDKPVKMGGRDLHVQTFQSNKPSDLEAFVTKAYQKGNTTETTVLYEAMFAGLDLIRAMPATDPRFLIVFTDGEDINSAFKGDVVTQAAQGLTNLRVFAIDYMPDPKIDPFLAAFTAQNHGQVRKAGTGADLLTLFRQFASRLDQYYVVTYEFPPPVVAAAPKQAEAPTAAAPPPASPAAAAAPPATPSATAEAPPTAAATPAPAAPQPEGGHSWWLWLLLLIVLILVVYFIARKSDDEKKDQKK
jgi:hypothetical protein